MHKKAIFKMNYFLIPLVIFGISYFGGTFTSQGLAWYYKLNLPNSTPSGSFIGMAWAVIYITAGLSALIMWNKAPAKPSWLMFWKKDNRSRFWWVLALFIFNAALNFLWTYLFFVQHLIAWSIVEMVILNITVFALIVLIWPFSKWASLLLWPYFIWVSFATFFAYRIWILN